MTELIKGFYAEGEPVADTKADLSQPISQMWELLVLASGLIGGLIFVMFMLPPVAIALGFITI